MSVDPTPWAAAATATLAAMGSAYAMIRGPGDLAKVTTDLKTAREEVNAAVRRELDELAAKIDTRLRGDLNTLATRVGDLEAWRSRRSEKHVAPAGPATSSPDLLARNDADHDRRIAKLEERADRTETAVQSARETLARIEGGISALRGRS